jgi:hypothetical protein
MMIDVYQETDLTDRQQVALAALVRQPSVRAAAKACGISEASIYRWKQHDQAFREALRAARWSALEESRKKLEAGADTATETLLDVMRDKTAPASARVAAARTLWGLVRSNYDLDEVMEMVEDLKADDAQTEAY